MHLRVERLVKVDVVTPTFHTDEVWTPVMATPNLIEPFKTISLSEARLELARHAALMAREEEANTWTVVEYGSDLS